MFLDLVVLFVILGGASVVTYLGVEMVIRSRRTELEVRLNELTNKDKSNDQ